MSKTTLKYIDIDLDIEYEFLEGDRATYSDPGSEPEAYIESIKVGGIDITILLDDGHLEVIAERVALAHEEEAEDVRGEQFMNAWKGLA